jgi:hypothetical protein
MEIEIATLCPIVSATSNHSLITLFPEPVAADQISFTWIVAI